jgi:hypothetical protein
MVCKDDRLVQLPISVECSERVLGVLAWCPYCCEVLKNFWHWALQLHRAVNYGKRYASRHGPRQRDQQEARQHRPCGPAMAPSRLGSEWRLTCFLGGFGITPLVQSGKAGFYSATAKFISWIATLPNADFWLPLQHDLTRPDTWACPRLATFRELHQQFCCEFKFTEWAPPANASADEDLAQVPSCDIAPILPPLNLLATLQVPPGEDGDNAAQRPEIPEQRRITRWIMQQVFSDAPQAPTPRSDHMLKLHRAQSILTVGPTREVDPRAYSILRLDMPHCSDANPDAPEHRLTYSSLAFLSPQYLTWTAQSGVAAGPLLTLLDWQSWFCQCLGIAPPAMAPYASSFVHAVGSASTPTTCTLARYTRATGIALTSSFYRPLLTLHTTRAMVPTAAATFQPVQPFRSFQPSWLERLNVA